MNKFREPRVQAEVEKYARILRYASDWLWLPKCSDASLDRDLERAITYLAEAGDHLTKLRRELKDVEYGTSNRPGAILFVDDVRECSICRRYHGPEVQHAAE